MLGVHARMVEVIVDMQMPVVERDRPEQAGWLYARFEIVNLCRQVADGACEEINSDEAERSPAPVPVATDVVAAHEPHVGIERVRRTVAPASRALNLGRSDDALEIGDGRHLEAQRRREDMDKRVVRDRVEVLVE